MYDIKTEYFWNETFGVAECIIYRGRKRYIGRAYCHTVDEEYKSERIGKYIAFTRASIIMYKAILKEEAYPGYLALKHLKSSYEQSYRYNPSSFEARVMKKEYFKAKSDVEELQGLIRDAKKELAEYLELRKSYQKTGQLKTKQPS